MTENNKYDAIGELFRQRLENHQIPVNSSDWSEIESRLNKSKSKPVIWLWLGGVAAAVVAALLMVGIPVTDKTPAVVVSQQVAAEKSEAASNKITPIAAEQEITVTPQPDVIKQTNKVTLLEYDVAENNAVINAVNDSVRVTERNEIFIAATANDDKTQTDKDKPATAPIVREIPKSNSLFVENITKVKKEKKWSLAAAFSMSGGRSEGLGGNNQIYAQSGPMPYTRSSGNKYATEMSSNIKSFTHMSEHDFTNIKHLPPLSFGVTMRGQLEKNLGIETGLVYTYLESRYEWSGYDVHQSLHYLGIPVNMLVYLWNSNSNWQIYLSGGLMIEKGLHARYNQEMRTESQIRTTTVKKNSIDGLQWSLNGGLGINYRLEKGWGIYFEPRVGYSFDCGQPISIRTEWPVYFGINMGLNYEL